MSSLAPESPPAPSCSPHGIEGCVCLQPQPLRGPHDGSSVTYLFGQPHSHRYFTTTATSLARAIRLFRVGAVFPHQYSSAPIATKVLGERGYAEDVYQASKPGAWIVVRVDREEIARIPPDEGDVDPRALAMLGGDLPGMEGTTALAPAGASTGLRLSSRTTLEQRQLDLQRAMGELEQQKRALELQVSEMKAELKRRMEQIWLIELFLGSHEEVHQLRDGAPAPADTPIAVRQQVLCMDEEIAVHDWFANPDRIGEFDCESVEDFDAWLVSNPAALDAICPWPKGVVGLRVRRHQKDRSDWDISRIFEKIARDTADAMTYLLVRNGEKLYRLWIDVTLWPRLFASEKDAQEAAGEVRGGWRSDIEAAQRRMKQQVAGLLALQGLLERSDLLHPLPRAGLNVFDPSCAEHFLLVRDDENRHALVDGQDTLAHVTWEDVTRPDPTSGDLYCRVLVRKGYKRWLSEQLDVGVRALWTKPRSSGDDKLKNRIPWEARNTVTSWPEQAIYTLDEKHTGYGGEFSFLFYPWVWRGFEQVRRTRGVRFRCYRDELLPVDFISWRVLEHLIRDRNQREHYDHFFRRAFVWWKLAKAETERERPFVDLVLQRCGVAHDDEIERARCERLLRWWKIKVKEHRTLGTAEAKALRMIEAAMKRGDDHDNDPEVQLMRTLEKRC